MKEIQKIRRDLHQIPELDKQLPKTIAYIKSFLSSLSCEIKEPSDSAISAYFDFGKAKTLAFRSDMDALAIHEQNNVAYRSVHSGQMHACGHDGHMAILLCFAKRVNALKRCKYNVLLLFQPAEETTGGAKEIVESEILKSYHVQAVFGLHLWPQLKEGVIASKSGVMMARACEITIQIEGISAHIARAEEGKDALEAAVLLLNQLYQMEEKWDKGLFLLRFGMIQSGNARNIIAEHAKLYGTLRTLDESIFQQLKAKLYHIGANIEKETGCNCHIHLSEGYPPLINDPALFQRCTKVLKLMELPCANMLSEDFSFYGSVVPSVFFYLGIGNRPPLHSSVFDFDDRLLSHGVEAYLSLLHIE